MRRFLLFVFCICAVSVTAQAQSESKPIDIYGGYSFLNARSDAFGSLRRDFNNNTVNLNGFNIGGTFWINSSRTIGITGDYTFHTKTEDTVLPGVTVGAGFTTIPGAGTPSLRTFLVPTETRLRYNTFQAGPAIRFKKGRLAPFAHVLFGATRISSRTRLLAGSGGGTAVSPLVGTFENDDTAFSLSVGGGLDVNLTESGRFAVRAGRIEYNYINSIASGFGFDNQQNLRFSTGLVVRF